MTAQLHPATVITEGGRVVGVQFQASPTGASSGPQARLRAGPGQVAHATHLEMPARQANHDDVERFHAEVERQLRPQP